MATPCCIWWTANPSWPTKYNRGIDYFLLMVMPTLGFTLATRRRPLSVLLALAAALTVAAGVNTTARVALAARCPPYRPWLCHPAPCRMAARRRHGCHGASAPVPAEAADPVPPRHRAARQTLRRGADGNMGPISRPMCCSGRLPAGGCGTSRLLPASPAEMAHFIRASGSGIYPHKPMARALGRDRIAGRADRAGLLPAGAAARRRPRAGASPFRVCSLRDRDGSGLPRLRDHNRFLVGGARGQRAALFAMFDRALTPSKTRISPGATLGGSAAAAAYQSATSG